MMPPKMLVRCEMNGADYHAPFTDGREYVATHVRNRLWEVTDDKGHTRYIIPGELEAHLQKLSERGDGCSQPVGRFVPVVDR
jgi:hypothetical protein